MVLSYLWVFKTLYYTFDTMKTPIRETELSLHNECQTILARQLEYVGNLKAFELKTWTDFEADIARTK